LLWVGPGYDPEKSFHVPCWAKVQMGANPVSKL
jgi:hypothetical protein